MTKISINRLNDSFFYKKILVFINNLYDFIELFNKSFSCLESNKEYFMMLLKYNDLDILFGEDVTDLDFIKLCVLNMYKNILTVYSYHDSFFRRNGISEEMNLNSSNDINTLFKFMKKIISCNSINYNVEYVFKSLVDGLAEYVDYNKNNIKEFEREYLIMFSNGWDDLINNFK